MANIIDHHRRLIKRITFINRMPHHRSTRIHRIQCISQVPQVCPVTQMQNQLVGMCQTAANKSILWAILIRLINHQCIILHRMQHRLQLDMLHHLIHHRLQHTRHQCNNIKDLLHRQAWISHTINHRPPIRQRTPTYQVISAFGNWIFSSFSTVTYAYTIWSETVAHEWVRWVIRVYESVKIENWNAINLAYKVRIVYLK